MAPEAGDTGPTSWLERHVAIHKSSPLRKTRACWIEQWFSIRGHFALHTWQRLETLLGINCVCRLLPASSG